MNIAICMYYNDNIAFYANYSKEINKIYCKKYNYDLIVANDKVIEYYYKNNYSRIHAGQFWANVISNTTPYYIRYYLLQYIIDDYDWVIWIDADAYFYNDAPPIENIIKHIDFSHSCILSYTIKQYLSDQNKDFYINNGVFLLKNIEDNKIFLDKMINNNDIKDIAEKLHYTYDQSVFRYLYDTNYKNFKDNSFVLNYGVLQHFYSHELKYLKYKPYIHHLAGTNNKIREKIIKNYYIKIKYFNWTNIFIVSSIGIYIGYILYNK